ncbi:predicted protein [Nematostella vectensis]|uniref:Uncharacterized protein n=1 Tax=Nematostella vectensis TaxID=45351 RepID=A7SKL6_NEMVE|nr:predicted protein [Nematostella vectensis]|eukprot:XP_001647515.1 predicted protein [Nematostella vectensis]
MPTSGEARLVRNAAKNRKERVPVATKVSKFRSRIPRPTQQQKIGKENKEPSLKNNETKQRKPVSKAKPAPDFSKLHSKWDNKLQKGKAVSKKPNTKVDAFVLADKSSITSKPLHTAYGGKKCVDPVEKEVEFEIDNNALQGILNNTGIQENQLKPQVSSRTSNVRTSINGKRTSIYYMGGRGSTSLYQRITGATSHQLKIPLRPLNQQHNKPVTQAAAAAVSDEDDDEISFKPDNQALKSILSGAGVDEKQLHHQQGRHTLASSRLSSVGRSRASCFDAQSSKRTSIYYTGSKPSGFGRPSLGSCRAISQSGSTYTLNVGFKDIQTKKLQLTADSMPLSSENQGFSVGVRLPKQNENPLSDITTKSNQQHRYVAGSSVVGVQDNFYPGVVDQSSIGADESVCPDITQSRERHLTNTPMAVMHEQTSNSRHRQNKIDNPTVSFNEKRKAADIFVAPSRERLETNVSEAVFSRPDQGLCSRLYAYDTQNRHNTNIDLSARNHNKQESIATPSRGRLESNSCIVIGTKQEMPFDGLQAGNLFITPSRGKMETNAMSALGNRQPVQEMGTGRLHSINAFTPSRGKLDIKIQQDIHTGYSQQGIKMQNLNIRDAFTTSSRGKVEEPRPAESARKQVTWGDVLCTPHEEHLEKPISCLQSRTTELHSCMKQLKTAWPCPVSGRQQDDIVQKLFDEEEKPVRDTDSSQVYSRKYLEKRRWNQLSSPDSTLGNPSKGDCSNEQTLRLGRQDTVSIHSQKTLPYSCGNTLNLVTPRFQEQYKNHNPQTHESAYLINSTSGITTSMSNQNRGDEPLGLEYPRNSVTWNLEQTRDEKVVADNSSVQQKSLCTPLFPKTMSITLNDERGAKLENARALCSSNTDQPKDTWRAHQEMAVVGFSRQVQDNTPVRLSGAQTVIPHGLPTTQRDVNGAMSGRMDIRTTQRDVNGAMSGRMNIRTTQRDVNGAMSGRMDIRTTQWEHDVYSNHIPASAANTLSDSKEILRAFQPTSINTPCFTPTTKRIRPVGMNIAGFPRQLPTPGRTPSYPETAISRTAAIPPPDFTSTPALEQVNNHEKPGFRLYKNGIVGSHDKGLFRGPVEARVEPLGHVSVVKTEMSQVTEGLNRVSTSAVEARPECPLEGTKQVTVDTWCCSERLVMKGNCLYQDEPSIPAPTPGLNINLQTSAFKPVADESAQPPSRLNRNDEARIGIQAKQSPSNTATMLMENALLDAEVTLYSNLGGRLKSLKPKRELNNPLVSTLNGCQPWAFLPMREHDEHDGTEALRSR